MSRHSRAHPDAPISHDWTGGGRKVKGKPAIKAGALVWVRDFEPQPLNRVAIVSDKPSEEKGRTKIVFNGCLWSARTKCLRIIATADEIKQRNKDRK
mgnify:FL=1